MEGYIKDMISRKKNCGSFFARLVMAGMEPTKRTFVSTETSQCGVTSKRVQTITKEYHNETTEKEVITRFDQGYSGKNVSLQSRPQVEAKSPSKGSQFALEALQTHNHYRKKHGVNDLILSQELCDFARNWAQKLALTNDFKHRPQNPYGENLFCCWSSNPESDCDGIEPVQSWYSENQHYSYGNPDASMSTGHFTQVVWKESHQLGIAKARSKSGKIIVVANYDPPGNIIGYYSQNVQPPK